jgi:hypothetical protein
MRVYTLWHAGDTGEVPWIINAVDQYTLDNCECPAPYLKHLADIHVRELIIDIPEDAVRRLFSAPSISATVLKEDQRAGTITDEPDKLLQTAREFGNGNARESDVAAAAYRLAASKLRAWGVESHAKDLENAAEQAEEGLASEWIARAP